MQLCKDTPEGLKAYQEIPFGFMRYENGVEVFFSCKRNPTLVIKDLKGIKVSFNVTLKNGKNRRQAYNIKRIEE